VKKDPYINLLRDVRRYAELPEPVWRVTRKHGLYRCVGDFIQALVLADRGDGSYYPSWIVSSLFQVEEGWPGHGLRVFSADRRQIWTLDDDYSDLATAFERQAKPKVHDASPAVSEFLGVVRGYYASWDTPFCEGIALFRAGKADKAAEALRKSIAQMRPEWKSESHLLVGRTLDAILQGRGADFLDAERQRRLALLESWVG
jgi:hypothetical protein